MNILHITLGFLPAVGWGGPVKTVYENGKELVRRGHRVTVFCSNLLNKNEKIHPYTFEQIIEGIRVVYFNALTISKWPGTLGPIWMPELGKRLQKEIKQFDVIHINGYRNLMFLPVVSTARKAHVPFVTQPHGMFPVIVNTIWIKRIYDWVIGKTELKGVSAVIALQEHERKQALSHGVPAERIHIIPNGIPPWKSESLPRKGSFRKTHKLSDSKPVILFLARINKKKGPDMLVEAFHRMRNSEAQLVIAGPDDGQLIEVQEMVQKYNLKDRVFFPGLLTGDGVIAAYQDADIFVLPCRADTFPMAIIEACQAGIPMVITDRCEIAQLVGGRVAEVVPFDPQSFADAMDRLLEDKRLYDLYHSNCSTLVKDSFSIQAVVDKLETLYAQVISETDRTRHG